MRHNFSARFYTTQSKTINNIRSAFVQDSYEVVVLGYSTSFFPSEIV